MQPFETERMNTADVSNRDFIETIGCSTTLWSPSENRYSTAGQELSNKVVLLYFSAQWCKPCKAFTPLLLNLYHQLKASHRIESEDFEIVYCSMDAFENEYEHCTKDMPWWCLCFQCSTAARLSQHYQAFGIPTLVVLDHNGTLICSDAVPHVKNNPSGFPWRRSTIEELLPAYYWYGSTKRSTQELKHKYLLLYSAGSWCQLSLAFTPKLIKAYEQLKRVRQDFEILFLSSDHDQCSFDKFYRQMPFCAIPFEERQAKIDIASQFNIQRIPNLMVFGPCSGNDRPLISSDVRHIFESNGTDYISEFPFRPKRYGDLNQMTDNINKCKCIIAFLEHCDDCEQETVQGELTHASERYMGEDMKFVWVLVPTQFTRTLREALKLSNEGQHQALLILLDIPDQASFYVMDKQLDISVASILDFLNAPGRRFHIA